MPATKTSEVVGAAAAVQAFKGGTARLRSILFDPANVMSLVRVPLAFLLWLEPQNRMFLLTVVAAAAVSDGLDGWIGRRTHGALAAKGTSNIGAWLDPVCDKIFVVSAALAVVTTYDAPLLVLPLLLVRDAAVAALLVVFRLAGGHGLFHAHDFRATPSGKATTVAQIATIVAIVVAPAAYVSSTVLPLAFGAATLGAFAVVDRVLLVLRQRSEQSDEPRAT